MTKQHPPPAARGEVGSYRRPAWGVGQVFGGIERSALGAGALYFLQRGSKKTSMGVTARRVPTAPDGRVGGSMLGRQLVGRFVACLALGLLALLALPARAQNFMVQCPQNTLWHPANESAGLTNYAAWPNSSSSGEPLYTGPIAYNPSTTFTNGVNLTYVLNGGAVKCQQISGGDGYMSEADGNQTFMFSFGPLSGLQKIRNGGAGTDYPDEFNQPYCDPSWNGGNYNNSQPNPYESGGPNTLFPGQTLSSCSPNGAVGYQPPAGYHPAVGQTILIGNSTTSATPTGVLTVDLSNTVDFPGVTHGSGYASPPTVSFASPQVTNGCKTNCVTATGTATIGLGSVIEVAITNPG